MKITIKYGRKTIRPYEFEGRDDITEVVIPETIKKIGEGAFADCKNLTKISMPSSIEKIGLSAFMGSPIKTSNGMYKAVALKGGKQFSTSGDKNTLELSSDWMEVKGEIKVAKNGLHFADAVTACFDYYEGVYGRDFVIYTCKAAGTIEKGTKHRCAAQRLKLERKLTWEEISKLF